MINFQDALKQMGDTHGGLWADEGVYCITKEIQLMIPEFTNILFLGLGGFIWRKLCWFVLVHTSKLLEFFKALVEIECYGKDVIKSVISGQFNFKIVFG